MVIDAQNTAPLFLLTGPENFSFHPFFTLLYHWLTILNYLTHQKYIFLELTDLFILEHSIFTMAKYQIIKVL